jgi:hypothetical protein
MPHTAYLAALRLDRKCFCQRICVSACITTSKHDVCGPECINFVKGRCMLQHAQQSSSTLNIVTGGRVCSSMHNNIKGQCVCPSMRNNINVWHLLRPQLGSLPPTPRTPRSLGFSVEQGANCILVKVRARRLRAPALPCSMCVRMRSLSLATPLPAMAPGVATALLSVVA